MSQVASAQPLSSFSVTSGRAEVVKSRSFCSRPSIASRTGPPTSAICLARGREAGAELIGHRARSGPAPRPHAPGRRLISRGSSDTGDHSNLAVVRGWHCGRASQGGTARADTIAAVIRPRSTRALLHVVGAVSLATGTLITAIVAAPAVATAATTQAHPTARTAQDPDHTALSVALTSMSPEIPRKGAITLAGRVTNTSEDDWTEINVAPFIAEQPITTRDELAAAANTAPDAAVGDRLTDPGTYESVGDLAPGRSAPFSIRIPVKSLVISGDSGVYWIGVHALGTSTEGRDLVADGRARTFIPLVTPDLARRRSVPVSVVLPFRDRARRAPDGSLNGPARWVGLTRSTGRLRRIVEFGASAGDAPIAWLVDPAVLDALDDFARGNPPLSLGPRRRAGQEPGGQPSEEPSPTASPSARPGPRRAERGGADQREGRPRRLRGHGAHPQPAHPGVRRPRRGVTGSSPAQPERPGSGPRHPAAPGPRPERHPGSRTSRWLLRPRDALRAVQGRAPDALRPGGAVEPGSLPAPDRAGAGDERPTRGRRRALTHRSTRPARTAPADPLRGGPGSREGCRVSAADHRERPPPVEPRRAVATGRLLRGSADPVGADRAPPAQRRARRTTES